MLGAILLVWVQAGTELYLPQLMATIVDEGIPYNDTALIGRVGLQMTAVTALSIAAAICSVYIAARTAHAFGRDLRSRLFAHVTGFSLQELDKFGAATLITRTTNDAQQVEHVVFMSMRMFTRAPAMGLISLFMAFATNPGLSWIFFASLPLLGLVVGVIWRKAMPLFRSLQEKLDRLNRVSREGLTGIRVIRAFNRTAYEEKRFDEANDDLTRTAIRVNRLISLMEPVMMLIMNFTMVAVIWFGGIRVHQGTLEMGELMAFIQYATHILFAFTMISMIFMMLPRASVSARRVAEILATQTSIRDPEQPKVPAAPRGVVEFRDVTFYYPGAEAPALSNISFTARPGQVTAIIGSIGSGKSTLARLLLRFYDVTSGSILVDGVDIREMSLAELRARIGYVPQTALLFTGTVAENLRYGKQDATEDEIRRAAESAQAASFVEALEGGYNALIAQGGMNLSGGQKQRLTIARALVRRPDIYVFDDNFSALDFKTDAKVRMALKEDTRDKTVIIIAQRVSTIMDADQIIVLDAGKIAGMGTHAELLQSCEIYREIVASQLAEEALASWQ